MRVLLDENMPLEFGQYIAEFDVDHLESIGLKGTRNGKLLALARQNYGALLTLDKGILHQHKHEGDLIILVIRVPNSLNSTVFSRAPYVIEALNMAKPGDLIELKY